MSKVSIIIPFYNCPYIDQAIESALNQTYENTEVIVVNDGSTQYEELLQPYLKKIRYIKKGNGGTATALNLGIQHATGDFFTWLSSDDLYDRDKVIKQITFMKKRNADISYSSYFLIDSKGKILSGPARVGFQSKLQLAKRMQQGCPINGCTVMLNTKIFKHVGLFERSLPFTHDYDLWMRILPHYSFHYFNEPIVMHRVHEDMGTKRFKERIEREIRVVQKKHRVSLKQLIQREESKK
jgi:glycosyltransferase involved in cell wall biosynthesis